MITATTVQSIPMEEVPKPNPIYKYRRWGNDKEKTVITERTIYMAAPNSFKDPKDCKNPIRYDLLSEEELVQLYYHNSLKENQNYSVEQHIAFANDWAKKSKLRDHDFVRQTQQNDFDEWNERMGVFCVTGDPTIDEMWKEYSADHTGYCIGFDSNIVFSDYFGMGGIIEYVDVLPIVKPEPFDEFMEQTHKQIFHKERKWEIENEYRVTKFSPTPHTKHPIDTRKIQLPPEAIKEIIFGKDMTEDHKKQIIDLISTTMSHVIFKQAELNGSVLIINDYII